MQQLHKWGAGSSSYALRASAPEEDPNNGEQPERFYQVGGWQCQAVSLDKTIENHNYQGAERPGEHCCCQADAKGRHQNLILLNFTQKQQILMNKFKISTNIFRLKRQSSQR